MLLVIGDMVDPLTWNSAENAADAGSGLYSKSIVIGYAAINPACSRINVSGPRGRADLHGQNPDCR
jgi:hypothetical protein